MSDWLYDAALSDTTEASFLELLGGSGGAEIEYRDEDGRTVLMKLAQTKDWVRAAEAVIERGCFVNAMDQWGYTALHYAAGTNRRDMVRILLERGANRTIKDGKAPGRTAAILAREQLGELGEDIAAYIDGAPEQAPLAERLRATSPRHLAIRSVGLTAPRASLPLRRLPLHRPRSTGAAASDEA